jgi:hypothetical protein
LIRPWPQADLDVKLGLKAANMARKHMEFSPHVAPNVKRPGALVHNFLKLRMFTKMSTSADLRARQFPTSGAYLYSCSFASAIAGNQTDELAYHAAKVQPWAPEKAGRGLHKKRARKEKKT